MATNLSTSFAGLALRNPVIVSSSGLTDSAAKVKSLSEAGAGAIVLKSLMEEQIMLEAGWQGDADMYPEGSDYLVGYLREHKLGEYLTLIRDSKKVSAVPVIASINCYQDAAWTDFARQIEEAGADALEVNILALQTDTAYRYGSFEQRHIDILARLKQTVGIPVIMKLGANLTNPVALIDQLHANGAAAIVLFNRFYQPDIDTERMKLTTGPIFSSHNELAQTLRWTGIASARVDQPDYAVSGGVSFVEDTVKALLAGASAVEMCSAIYRNGPEIIGRHLAYLGKWMEEKGFEHIAQFRGRLNMRDGNVNFFERTQFLKYFAK